MPLVAHIHGSPGTSPRARVLKFEDDDARALPQYYFCRKRLLLLQKTSRSLGRVALAPRPIWFRAGKGRRGRGRRGGNGACARCAGDAGRSEGAADDGPATHDDDAATAAHDGATAAAAHDDDATEVTSRL